MDENLIDLISRLQKNAKEAEELIRKIGLLEKPQIGLLEKPHNSFMMPEMIRIPAPPGDTYTLLEGDGVPVPLTAFSIGKYPVTQAEWEAVMGNNPSHFQGENLPHFVNDNLPVESVSWHEATAFCEKLSDSLGLTGADRYRLPTEAEWEWAASGGTGDRKITKETGWYYDNAKGTIPVGRKAPNGFGLFDTLGNVCEWTATEYGAFRVLRGGCWFNVPRFARVAYRYGYAPGNRSDGLGFRLARG